MKFAKELGKSKENYTQSASALANEAMRRPIICLQEACTKSKVLLYSISTFSLQFVVGFYLLGELYHGSLNVRCEPEVAYAKGEDTQYAPTDEGEI